MQQMRARDRFNTPAAFNMSRSGTSGAAKRIRIEDGSAVSKPVYLFSLQHFAAKTMARILYYECYERKNNIGWVSERRQDKKVLRVVLKLCRRAQNRFFNRSVPPNLAEPENIFAPAVRASWPVLPIRHAASPKSSTNFPSSVTSSSTFHSRLDCVSNVWSIDWR